jgi:hypothetical protein
MGESTEEFRIERVGRAIGPLQVFQGIAAAAGIIAGLKSILEDHDQINEQLNAILARLQQIIDAIIVAAADILEAIDGIRRQIDEDVASDNMALADTALFNDLVIFDNKQEAMSKSFQAASRLEREVDLVFVSSFMYVVNIRLAVLKDFNPNYFCVEQFQNEFRRYQRRLAGWIAQFNDLIARSHIVGSGLTAERFDKDGVFEDVPYWLAWHTRSGTVVATFKGPFRDVSEAARRRVERQANVSRDAGIQVDRRDLGVVDMENTLAAWEEAFQGSLRRALVSQVLNRRSMAIDSNPHGLMVDGRILPANLDMRTTLVELLTSREFRRRMDRSWDAFVERGNDQLVQFAHRRLFDRDATDDEVALLRGIASKFGYASLMAALAYNTEYEERYGRGLPVGRSPVADAFELPE